MRRNALRPLWVILALLLLVEAWLWDHLEPIVARLVNLVPWRRLKIAVARWIEDLPPYAALVVFVVPFIVVLPAKFLGLYFIATGNWFGTVATLSLAKLVGLGVTAFVFDATRHKLLQISGECTTGSCGRVIGRTRRLSRSVRVSLDYSGCSGRNAPAGPSGG
jgi:hypothetical protein